MNQSYLLTSTAFTIQTFYADFGSLSSSEILIRLICPAIHEDCRIPANLSYVAMSLACHNPQEVAQLIYDSAPEMFFLLWGRAAIATIQKLVVCSRNRFSHRYIRVAESEGQVIGIATIVPAVELDNQTDYHSMFSFWLRLRWKLVYRLILSWFLKDAYPADSFYIGNLAVHPAYRGHGIGTQLLLHCIAEAKAAGANQVLIRVNVNNPRAQKLYESLGFQVVSTKTISLLKTTLGSRVLALSLANP